MATKLAMKARECVGCNGYYIETKEEEVSRKIKREKMLCGNCLRKYEEYKQKKNISRLTYIGEYEPLPFNPLIDIEHDELSCE